MQNWNQCNKYKKLLLLCSSPTLSWWHTINPNTNFLQQSATQIVAYQQYSTAQINYPVFVPLFLLQIGRHQITNSSICKHYIVTTVILDNLKSNVNSLLSLCILPIQGHQSFARLSSVLFSYNGHTLSQLGKCKANQWNGVLWTIDTFGT